MSTIQLIGPGSSPSAIDAPESTEAAASPEEHQEPITFRNARTRAPRVTGSFDHPMLPMPPVGIISINLYTPLISFRTASARR